MSYRKLNGVVVSCRTDAREVSSSDWEKPDTAAQTKKEVTISCERDIISDIYRSGFVKNRPKRVNWSVGLLSRRAGAATGGILVCFGELAKMQRRAESSQHVTA